MLIALFTVNNATAQESSTYDYDMGYAGTWLVKNLRAVDSIGVGDSVWFYTVRKYSTEKVYPVAKIVLDSLGGTPADVTVTLEHKVWVDDAWTVNSTVTYTGTADTTIRLSDTTARIADFWRLKVACANDGFHVGVTSVSFKLVY